MDQTYCYSVVRGWPISLG